LCCLLLIWRDISGGWWRESAVSEVLREIDGFEAIFCKSDHNVAVFRDVVCACWVDTTFYSIIFFRNAASMQFETAGTDDPIRKPRTSESARRGFSLPLKAAVNPAFPAQIMPGYSRDLFVITQVVDLNKIGLTGYTAWLKAK
jgi:hypothetical protein